MSEQKNTIKELPDTNHEFEINVIGDITSKCYTGTFSCKIMNQKETAKANKHEAHLNGPDVATLDPGTQLLHRQIAYLRFALIDYPQFWLKSDLGYELFDFNIINEVFSAVIKWEDEWMKKIWGAAAVAEMRKRGA